MSIFDSISNFFKKDTSPGQGEEQNPEVRMFVDNLLDEAAKSRANQWDRIQWKNVESYCALEDKPSDFQIAVLKDIVSMNIGKAYIYTNDPTRLLASRLMQKKSLPLTSEDVSFFLKAFTHKHFEPPSWPFLPLISHIERLYSQNPEDEVLDKSIKRFLKVLSKEGEHWQSEKNKMLARLKRMLQDDNQVILKKDFFGKVINDFVGKNKGWNPLITHLINVGSSSYPSQKWMDQAKKLSENVGTKKVTEKTLEWLCIIEKRMQDIHGQGKAWLPDDENIALVRGLIWNGANLENPELNSVVEHIGLLSFKKVPGFGPLSVKIGNSCVYMFTRVPVIQGVPVLSKYKSKIKYASTLKYINNALQKLADSKGISTAEVEEQGVPGFGFDEQYEIKQPFGEYEAVIRLEGLSDVNLYWRKDEKDRKSIPADIKIDFKSEISELRKQIKEIKTTLSAQRWRLESCYLDDREWEYDYWAKLYETHPFISYPVSRLIWHFEEDNRSTSGFMHNDKWCDSNGQPINWITSSTRVRLWHPSMDTVENIRAWRNFIEDNQYRQPFKQAHREIYILTDAEVTTETYSNRFAAHILRQHQFAALCQQRFWKYHLQGQWDSHNTPTRQIPAFNMYAEYWVDAPWEGEAGPSGIFNYVHTDQVRFYDNREGLLPLLQVPRIVFSEIMRDVDLFVGVTSIGNDPSWADGRNEQMDNYWTDYSTAALTENARVRKELLEKIISRLKIAKVAKFDDRFLRIAGKKRIYKIHMGSGNILMEPDNSYLCIVPDQSKNKLSKVYLPFEGDRMLSIILSKAILLADDDKITDQTILSQINRR